MSDKNLNDLIKIATAQGWVITIRNNNHLKWKSPSGFVYFSSYTPSDFRAVKNIRAALVREGLLV